MTHVFASGFRLWIFLLVLCTFGVVSLRAQTGARDIRELRMLQPSLPTPDLGLPSTIWPTPSPTTLTEPSPGYLTLTALNTVGVPPREQPLCYAADELAFFCRLEVKLEQKTRMPVRFRLGDVQQVDYLEGKFSGWRYGY